MKGPRHPDLKSHPSQQTMPAITLRPPWGFAVARLGRAMENCVDLIPEPSMLHGWLALHQGKRWGEEQRMEALTLAEAFPDSPVPLEAEGYPQGVVAIARLVGLVDARRSERLVPRQMARWDVAEAVEVDLAGIAEAHKVPLGAALSPTATIVGFGRARSDLVAAEVLTSPWWQGPVAWLFGDIRPLAEPVPMPGRPDIWWLQPSDDYKVRRAAGLAR